ncbi:hypothetical protein OIE66_06905 [Nonomuraea sp. NBC_01738]|uniref:hypothetical protein n=1 Tax=Nonomuraea sp. NBC_01738 TaxID=2976003 RepID=UPI002E0F9531|nr:hypothetical protein OIE66_06905 [Nonomuraea sp. NBC_01738]
MARRSRTSMVLAGLSLAGLGLLAPMGSAAAATPPPSPTKESTSVQQAPSLLAYECWTTVSQPGGNGTTIYVYYRNCGSTSARVTANSHAVAFEGSYTYINLCSVVRAGETWRWTIPPGAFPPVDTTRWGITNCM